MMQVGACDTPSGNAAPPGVVSTPNSWTPGPLGEGDESSDFYKAGELSRLNLGRSASFHLFFSFVFCFLRRVSFSVAKQRTGEQSLGDADVGKTLQTKQRGRDGRPGRMSCASGEKDAVRRGVGGSRVQAGWVVCPGHGADSRS